MRAFYYWAIIVYVLLAIYLGFALLPETNLNPELLAFRKAWPDVILSHFFYATVYILIGGAVLVIWKRFFNEDLTVPKKLYYLSLVFLATLIGLVLLYL